MSSTEDSNNITEIRICLNKVNFCEFGFFILFKFYPKVSQIINIIYIYNLK